MTYCVAVMLDAGMVFASDSRTNAGRRPDRAPSARCTSSTRTATASIVSLELGQPVDHAKRDQPARAPVALGDSSKTIRNATSMFDIAGLIGNALREVKTRDGPYLQQNNIEAHAVVHRRRTDAR